MLLQVLQQQLQSEHLKNKYMKTIQAAIVSFGKPYFTYNTNGIKVLPTNVESGNESVTTLESGDQFFEAETIEEVMAEFERLGFVMPEENTWDEPSKPIQVFITHAQNSQLMLSEYGLDLLSYFKTIQAPTHVKNDGIYIYLEEVYPEHRYLLENFGIKILNQ